MPQFIVNAVTVKRENIESQYGMFKSVDLTLQEYGTNTPIVANWYTKQDSPLPAVGATFDGDVSQSEYGLKIKRAQKGGGPGPGGGGMSPERQRAIQRQHSQDMAIQTLTLAGTLGLLPEMKGTNALFDLLSLTADWFDRDVNRTANPQPEGQS